MHPPLVGIFFSAFGFTLFSVGDLLFKTLSADYSIFQLIPMVGCVSMFVYLAAAPYLGGIPSIWRTKNFRIHIIRALIGVVQVGTIMYAFSHLPMATVYTLVFIAPAITTVLAMLFLREPVRLAHGLAICLGFAGVLIVLRPGLVPLNIASLCVLLSALTLSSANILSRFIGKSETLLSLVFFPQLFVIVILGALSAPAFEMPTPSAAGLVVLCGFLNAAGMLSVVFSFVKTPAGIVAPFQYIQIIWGVLFGYLFFGDALDVWTGLGAFVIILSGFWLLRHARREGSKDKIPS
ncbi:MAG: DMT family transporter [Alphaproteobacteria bacterium]|nr:DMT family transporter [Alphaproteobacteria bacterium]